MSIKPVIASALLLLAASAAHAIPVFYTDFASFDAASSATLVEDFESAPVKDTALASYSSNGITYAPTGVTNNVWVASPGYPNFNIGGSTTSSILTVTGDEHFLVTPDAPLFAIGFDVYLNDFAPAYLNVFGSSGLLGSFDLTTLPTDQIGFLGMTSTDAITQLEWFTTNGGQINTGIDNIYIQAPAPSVLLLLFAGLPLMWLLRRRSRV